MSPVFRHGGLRLYLLKLLDEAPRHGYDVIRLLQDRFLGVYSPSPGTIYPRLARLEEEGLVTHETVDGKKIYKITDAGRAELNRRLDDLADLEDELAASVRDIAREISRDVRETVRSLRDELTFAVREANRSGRPAGSGPGPVKDTTPADDRARSNANDATGRGERDRAHEKAPASTSDRVDAGDRTEGADQTDAADRGAWATSTAESDSDEALARAEGTDGSADDARPAGSRPEDARPGDSAQDAGPRAESSTDSSDGTSGAGDDSGEGSHDRRRGDWRDWTDWAERGDWREWADWAKRQPWGDWVGKQDWKERAKAGRADWSERAQSGWAPSGWAQSGRQDWIRGGGGPKDRGDRRDAGPDLVSDLEHLAAAFAREIRGVARQAENAGEDAVGSLGRILGDALNRIRTEVFKPQDQSPPPPPPEPPAPPEAQAPPEPPAPPEAQTPPEPPAPPEAQTPP
ncbi:MAG TPA: helix-turn-helix transcriptional regulator, partial [Streptosporangiaceae bacterium]|nr:helix-turn-helix transcriptional regulator [Streptosporangiaceae bacterium]